MPGMTSKLHLISHEEGTYKGVSSNYSGYGFADMKFDTVVVSEKNYSDWVTTTKSASSTLDITRYKALSQKSKNNKVEYFSTVEPQLFDAIIMKFMSPEGMRAMSASSSPNDSDMMHMMHHD
jgi:cytochrome o ubiquinol oxidase subunit 2